MSLRDRRYASSHVIYTKTLLIHAKIPYGVPLADQVNENETCSMEPHVGSILIDPSNYLISYARSNEKLI